MEVKAATQPGRALIYQRWPTEADLIADLERIRWGQRPTCPYCGANRVARNRDRTPPRWQCQHCKRSFSVTVGTPLHHTHVDLRMWLAVASMLDMPTAQAARELGMRRQTVAAMMRRIRENALLNDLLVNTLGVDKAG